MGTLGGNRSDGWIGARLSTAALGLIALSLVLSAAACIPTVARTNARLEPGVDFAIAGANGVLFEGEDEDGNTTETSPAYLHAELGLQYARRGSDNGGFAVQLKVPLAFVFTTLEAYYEFPSTHPWYYGAGIELGAFPGIYGTVTRYLSQTSYLSFTQRVSSNIDDRASATQVNPQISFGVDNGAIDLSVFASYAYLNGRGLNVKVCLFDDCGKDYRNQFGLIGAAVRF